MNICWGQLKDRFFQERRQTDVLSEPLHPLLSDVTQKNLCKNRKFRKKGHTSPTFQLASKSVRFFVRHMQIFFCKIGATRGLIKPKENCVSTKPEAYLELSQTYKKMEFFAISIKKLHHRWLTGFWLCL